MKTEAEETAQNESEDWVLRRDRELLNRGAKRAAHEKKAELAS